MNPAATPPPAADATALNAGPPVELAAAHPSLAAVLALDSMTAAAPRVVAGADLLQRPVRWTHVAEIADIAGLLRGGELLFTTGVLLPDTRAGLRRYVAELSAAGAAGLVVELGRRFTGALPQALVAAAAEHNLPLVELGRQARFVVLTEQIHALIADAQLAQLRASNDLHHKFTALTVGGASTQEVIAATALLGHAPVVLEDLGHRVLALDAADASAADLLAGWENRSRAIQVSDRTGVDPRTGWLVTQVGARGQDWGRLLLVLREPALPFHAMLVERAAQALALGRLVERDAEGVERQAHRGVLEALLELSAGDDPEVPLARARAVGVPLDGRWLVGIVLRAPAPPGTAGMGVTPILARQKQLAALAEQVAAAARRARVPALVAVLDDEGVTAVLTAAQRGRADGLADELAVALAGESPAPNATGSGSASESTVPLVAVGTPVALVRDLRRSLQEAAHVADSAGQRAGSGVLRLRDVRLAGLLHLLRHDSRLHAFVERELGPILEYDAQHGTDLTGALRTYLAAGRNKAVAARASHLSRPGFYDRLHKVELVLGVELDDVDSCLSLQVALLALDNRRR